MWLYLEQYQTPHLLLKQSYQIFIRDEDRFFGISVTAEVCFEIFSKFIVNTPYYDWELVNHFFKSEYHFFHQQQHTSHHQDLVKIYLGSCQKFLWTQLFALSWFLSSIQHGIPSNVKLHMCNFKQYVFFWLCRFIKFVGSQCHAFPLLTVYFYLHVYLYNSTMLNCLLIYFFSFCFNPVYS